MDGLASFDVWLNISNFLSVTDLLNLQAVREVCKDMHGIINQHAVWFNALQDILTVVPLWRLVQKSRCMSLEDLKRRAIIAARLAHKTRCGSFHPEITHSYQCGASISSVQLLTGTEWILVLLRDGTLRLQSAASESAIAAVDKTHQGDPADSLAPTMCVRSSRDYPSIRVRLPTLSSRLSLYRIDTATASIHPLLNFAKNFPVYWYSLTSTLLLFGWIDRGSHSITVTVRTISSQDEKSVTVDFSTGVPLKSYIFFWSESQFGLVNTLGLHAYDVAELLQEQDRPNITRLQFPPPSLHDQHSQTYPHRAAQIGSLGPIVLPVCTYSPDFDHSRCPPHPVDLWIAASHLSALSWSLPKIPDAVFCPGRAIVMCGDVYVTFATASELDKRGMTRLGEIHEREAPRMAWTVPIELGSVDLYGVVEVSWDEELGRLCLVKAGSNDISIMYF